MPSPRQSTSIYDDVRTALAALLSAATGFTFLNHTPMDNSLWGMLPAGVADLLARPPNEWRLVLANQETMYLLCEGYIPIADTDTSGAQASTAVATCLAQMENAVLDNTFLPSVKAEMELVSSKIEAFAVQPVEQAGVKARLAWVVVKVKVSR